MDLIRRTVFQRSLKHRDCTHLDTISVSSPETDKCDACLEEQTQPVHLRMCLSCGEVACCDSSSAKHARRHYEQTGHPLIRSVEPGERWVWCYVDRAYLGDMPAVHGE